MKKTTLKITLSAIVLLFAVVNSNAQEKKAETKPAVAATSHKNQATSPDVKPQSTVPALSKLPEPMKNMMKFMGRWKADATMVADGKTRQVEYHITGRGTAEGNGIYIDEFFSDSVLGNMKGGNLVGYNLNDQKIHWFSVDNQGTTHEHVGNWGSPDSLHIEHSSVAKGKNYNEKIDFVFASREEFKLKWVATLDGKETQRNTGVFYREKQVQKDKSKQSPPAERK